MHIKKLPLAILAVGLVACGSDNGSSDKIRSTQPASIEHSHREETASAGLWDTKHAYGYEVEKPATGIDRGKQVYEQWCIICHGAGVGMAGTDSLSRKYTGLDIPALLTERNDLHPATTKMFVRKGVKSMPYFRKTEISDEDLELLAQYLAPEDEE